MKRYATLCAEGMPEAEANTLAENEHKEALAAENRRKKKLAKEMKKMSETSELPEESAVSEDAMQQLDDQLRKRGRPPKNASKEMSNKKSKNDNEHNNVV